MRADWMGSLSRGGWAPSQMRCLQAIVLASALALTGCADRLAASRLRMFDAIQTHASQVPVLARDPHFAAAVAAEKSLHREDFVPREARQFAQFQFPVPIGWGQTISDPYIVAVMSAAAQVKPGDRVLEVGTGSGYQAAVLARLGAKVSTIEIVPELASRAAKVLARLGFTSVEIRTGDGFIGWSDHAPFAAIIVTAGSDRVPQPLLDQLAPGGRLLMPVGKTALEEQIIVITRAADGSLSQCSLGLSSFVALTGKAEQTAVGAPTNPALSWCYGAPVT
jgi:protein-L-isoaspartate(D-aspartate) O-methyltransferase